MLTAARAREIIAYDPERGTLTALVRRGNCTVGKVLGTKGPNGYLYLGIDYGTYLAHRVAWLIQTGEWPAGEVDHEDRDPSNLRWANLRDASRTQNNANTGKRSHSRQPFKGVEAHGRRWRASITVDGKRTRIGSFSTALEAALAYDAAARTHFGAFASANFAAAAPPPGCAPA